MQQGFINNHLRKTLRTTPSTVNLIAQKVLDKSKKQESSKTHPLKNEKEFLIPFPEDSFGRYTETYRNTELGQEHIRIYFGDLTKQQDLMKLHGEDPSKFHYFYGDEELANELLLKSLHVENKWSLRVPGGSRPIHTVVKIKNGTYADSLGIWSESFLIKIWRKKRSKVQLFIDTKNFSQPPSESVDERFLLLSMKIIHESIS